MGCTISLEYNGIPWISRGASPFRCTIAFYLVVAFHGEKRSWIFKRAPAIKKMRTGGQSKGGEANTCVCNKVCTRKMKSAKVGSLPKHAEGMRLNQAPLCGNQYTGSAGNFAFPWGGWGDQNCAKACPEPLSRHFKLRSFTVAAVPNPYPIISSCFPARAVSNLVAAHFSFLYA